MFPKRYDIQLSGKGDIDGLLAKLAWQGVTVKSLSIEGKTAYFQTDKKGVQQLRRHRRSYQLSFTISHTLKEQDAYRILMSYRFLIACFIPLVCSFFLWSVQVQSDQIEVVDRIESKLESASIKRFQPLALLPEEGDIRRLLMLNDSSLSWVRFKKSGASLTVIPMLTPASEKKEQETKAPSHLYAKTGGVITRFELESGERIARVHQTVRKGDALATGILEQGNKTAVVGAKGEVFADYWLEYRFSIPKTVEYEYQGEESVQFSFSNPWKKESSFDWKELSPRSIIQTERLVQNTKGKVILEEGMEETVLIPLMRHKLLSVSSPKAVIKEEKILHASFDNDKVSGTILFLVNDDIAIQRPISQGD